MKRSICSFLLILSLAAPMFCHAASSVDRLSLFIYDGITVYEDRRDSVQVSRLPAGVTVDFTAGTDGNGEPVWSWVLTNTNTAPLDSFTVTGFIDADIGAAENTFFNEHAQLLALGAPEGAIAPVRWEAGEPGYHHGDLLARAATGALANVSRHDSTAPDDIALALSADIDTLQAGQSVTITAALTASGQDGVRQQDAADGTVRIFTLHAEKGAVPGLSSSDYALVKTADAPSVRAGETAGYTLQVSNLGPDDGEGVRISDLIPAGLTGAVWRCVPGGGAVCGIDGGAGNTINLTARIPVGDSVTVHISGTAAVAGELINTATITPADAKTSDPEPLNDRSSAVITVTEESGANIHADLSLVKTTSTPVASVGGRIRYQIEVRNAGPEQVAGARIRDEVPAAIGNVTWICTASQGAVCAEPEGSGNTVSASGDLPAGGRMTLQIEGTAQETGTHTNIASVSGAGRDPNPDNNESRVDVHIHTGAKGGSTTRLETTAAVLQDGEVWVWGYRAKGLQGNGVMTVANNVPPAKVQNLPLIIQLAAGARHILALDEHGDLWGWGENDDYETGCTQNGNRDVATPCHVMSNVIQVAAGREHSMALDDQGQVWTWGKNNNKALGRGANPSKLPMTVDLQGERARLIGTGYDSSFAVTEEGHVWAWGSNGDRGLAIDVSTLTFDQPIRVINLYPYALRIVQITGGEKWGVALLDDGHLISWGRTEKIGIGLTGSAGVATPRLIATGVAQLFATTHGGVILGRDRRIYTWGKKDSALEMLYGVAPVLRITYGVPAEIGGGDKYILYRIEDGRLYGVGQNEYYKLNQSKCCTPHVQWPGWQILMP